MVSDEDLEHLVEIHPGQGTFSEYRHLRDTIRQAAPGNLLILGVAKDSRLWVDENADGHTVFMEHEPERIRMTREQLPDSVPIHQVTYPTRRTQWKNVLHRGDKLFMTDLPNRVLSTNWDVIYLDSPRGGSRKRPGRMMSIYTAGVLAQRSTDGRVLVHDCERTVERV